jgi:PAS domain S-box-containing protein
MADLSLASSSATAADLVQRWRPWVFKCLVFGAVYGMLARLGLAYASIPPNVTLIWAPTGLSLFVLLRGGPKLWPGIVLGDLIANAGSGTSWAAIAGITLGNVAQAVLCRYALERVGFRPSLDRVQDALALLLLGSGATAVSAALGIASLWSAGLLPSSGVWIALLQWMMGDATGVAVLTPWLLAWQRWRLDRWSWRSGRTSEVAALLGLLLAVSAVVFSGGLDNMTWGRGNDFSALVLFPLVIWAALRFGLRGATLATLLISMAAVAGTVHGLGPFAIGQQTEGLTRWWMFASIISVTGLLLASSQMERDGARAEAVRDRDFGNAIFDAEGALLIVLDAENRIERVNHALELATGFSSAALVGQKFDLALVPEDQREKVKGHSDLLQMRVSERARHDSTLRRRHGPPITVSWTMSAIRGPDGRLRHAIVSGVDISARVEAAAALRGARRELESRVAERTRDLAEANAALQVQMAERARLESEVIQVSEREQQRFGRELHDGLGQHLTAAAIQAELLARDLEEAGQHAAQQQAEQVEAMLSQAVADTRMLARGLFPVDIDGDGLKAALEEFTTSTQRQLRRACTLECSQPVDISDQEVAVHLYRIAQEAVNNAVKHAPASAIVVLLHQQADGGVRLRISNSPHAEGADRGQAATGIGLHMMQHRARLIGGRFRAGPSDGGWCVEVFLPPHLTASSEWT